MYLVVKYLTTLPAKMLAIEFIVDVELPEAAHFPPLVKNIPGIKQWKQS